MRLAVIGDVQGDLHRLGTLVAAAADAGAQQLLQLGDLAHYDTGDPAVFHRAVDMLLRRHQMPCTFIDGNHDHMPWLTSRPATGGLHQLGDALTYAGRGARWTWAGLQFMAVGGAATFNPARRTAAVDWWPEQELISPCDEAKAIGGGTVDVLVCHEIPAGIDVPGDVRFPRGTQVRDTLARVVAATKPALVLHGHRHLRTSSAVRTGDVTAYVEGLARIDAAAGDAVVVLELPSLDLSPLQLFGPDSSATSSRAGNHQT